MSHSFYCPYLGVEVELSDQREQHIVERHPGTLPDYVAQLAETLELPDLVRRSSRDDSSLLFSRWFDSIRTGRHLVVITVSEQEPVKHWVITAYTARRISGGEQVWPTDDA